MQEDNFRDFLKKVQPTERVVIGSVENHVSEDKFIYGNNGSVNGFKIFNDDLDITAVKNGFLITGSFKEAFHEVFKLGYDSSFKITSFISLTDDIICNIKKESDLMTSFSVWIKLDEIGEYVRTVKIRTVNQYGYKRDIFLNFKIKSE